MRQCQALNSDHKKCRRKAVIQDYYFGNAYCNNGMPTWVQVCLCETHRRKTNEGE